MVIKIYCDKINEYECMRHMLDAGLLNPGFEDANAYKEKFNLEEDKLSVEYYVKEFYYLTGRATNVIREVLD